ncbi:ANTAR domain-containing protein [Longispora urticae]
MPTTDRVLRAWMRISGHSDGAPITMAHVCSAAVAAAGVDGAAVTVMVDATVRDAVHSTDRIAAELEEWQLSYGQGPCVDAFTVGGPVLVVDLDTPVCAARWPAFTPAALGSGARAVFVLPIHIGAIELGVLALYRRSPGDLSAHELADALAFAQAAGTLLLDAADDTRPETADLAWQEDDDTAHHAQVHQATGMILVQLGSSAQTAFARLRAYAYAADRRLGDVARDVVERRLRFEPDPPPGGENGK